LDSTKRKLQINLLTRCSKKVAPKVVRCFLATVERFIVKYYTFIARNVLRLTLLKNDKVIDF